jgi:peptidoglycan-associated lipoprotein
MTLDVTRLFKSPALIASILALSLATGCHKKQGPDPNSMGPSTAPSSGPSPTASITADPLSIDLGQSVVLNWRSQNANVVTIDGIGQVNVNGTQTVSPSNSTNFHLTAKGDGGTVEANVRVTVNVPVAPTPPAADSSTADMGSDAVFHQNVPDVFFDYDSYDLRPDATSAATQAAHYLTAHPAIKVVVGGYCDNRGSAEYNLALGENRANSAKGALVSAGVAASRIRVVSFGKEKQFCSDETESCWQQNRRAQFSVDR